MNVKSIQVLRDAVEQARRAADAGPASHEKEDALLAAQEELTRAISDRIPVS